MGLLDSLGPISDWPVLRQLKSTDLVGLGKPAFTKRTIELVPRTRTADTVVKSICPYCAVGCGQNVYVKDGKITDIEGDPGSPISQGCLCPKGAATFQLVTGSHRVHQVLYRRPGGTRWETLPLEQAMDMVAERVKEARDSTWKDNEENYLIKKLFTSLGMVQIENQARI